MVVHLNLESGVVEFLEVVDEHGVRLKDQHGYDEVPCAGYWSASAPLISHIRRTRVRKEVSAVIGSHGHGFGTTQALCKLDESKELPDAHQLSSSGGSIRRCSA